MISNYFKENKLFEYDREQFYMKKNIELKKIIESNKTICQMLRNINFLTKNKYKNEITDLIKYVNDAVLKLREYKSNFDKNWWKDNTNLKKRTDFSLLKKNIVNSKKIINIKHFTFIKLKELFNNEKNNNIRELIIEICYYLYKINLKLLEYETIEKLNSKVFINYNEYWKNVENNLNNFKEKNFDIFFSKELVFDGKKRDIFYLNRKINCIYNKNNIKNYFDLSRKYVEDIIINNKYDCIIEFGCGWGRNIFHYFSKIGNLLDDIEIIGGEFTKGGLNCANNIKNKFFKNKKIKFIHFDYNNPELFFEQISLINDNFKNVLGLSFWSIEQVTNINITFFNLLLENFKKIRFVHHEPIGWQIDNKKSFMKENKIGSRDYYNKNLYEIIQNLNNNKKININNIILNYFNFKTTQSMGSLIEWEKI